MHWNDGLGARAKRLFKAGRVHRVGGLVNIDKHRPSSTVSNGLGSGHKCIGNGDYFVARPNAARQKREPKRFCPTADADSVPASTIRRKIRLELFDERSAGKGAAVNHLADRALKLRPESRVVSVKVEKWYSNMHWFSQAQDRGNVPHRGRILGHLYYNCGSGATVAPSPPLPTQKHGSGTNGCSLQRFATQLPAASSGGTTLRSFAGSQLPLADCDRTTAAPFALSEADAASRIQTSYHPYRPPLAGRALVAMQTIKFR